MLRFVERNKWFVVLAVCGVDIALWALLWRLFKGFIEQPILGTGIGMLLVAVFSMRAAYLRDHPA